MGKEIKKTKKMTIDDLAGMMSKRFDMVEKDISQVSTDLKSFKTETGERFNKVDKDISQVSTDLKSFKTETGERFDKVDNRLDEIDENISGIVKDYHPHIIALEEKVFGSSTLAES